VYYDQINDDCPYGGEKVEGNCEIFVYKSEDLHWGTAYWVLIDPPWPGVYYEPSDGKCPFGGKRAGWGNNCEMTVFELPELYVERGVEYWVDTEKSPGFILHNAMANAPTEEIKWIQPARLLVLKKDY
jgi:hypothetical protein